MEARLIIFSIILTFFSYANSFPSNNTAEGSLIKNETAAPNLKIIFPSPPTTLTPPITPSTTASPPQTTQSNSTFPTKATTTTASPPQTTQSNSTPTTNATTTAATTTTTTTAPTTQNTTSKTATPSTSTIPSTSTPIATSSTEGKIPPNTNSQRQFDGPSFIGGIVLTLGLTAIGFIAFKFYIAGKGGDSNYRTLY